MHPTALWPLNRLKIAKMTFFGWSSTAIYSFSLRIQVVFELYLSGSCSVFSGASTSSSLIKMCSLCLRPFPCPAHTVAALAAAAPGATRTAAHAPARAAAASPALAVAAVAAVAAAAAPKTLCLAAKVDRLRHKSLRSPCDGTASPAALEKWHVTTRPPPASAFPKPWSPSWLTTTGMNFFPCPDGVLPAHGVV